MEKCKKILISKGFCMMMALVICLTLFGSISANAATRADDIAGSFTNLSEYSNVDIYLNETGDKLLLELSIEKDRLECLKTTVVFYNVYGNIVKERTMYDYLSGKCTTGEAPSDYHAVSIPISAYSYSVVLSSAAYNDYVKYGTCGGSEEYIDAECNIVSSSEHNPLKNELTVTLKSSASISVPMYYSIAIFDDKGWLKDVFEGSITVVSGTNKIVVKTTGTYNPSKWICYTGILNANWIPDDIADGNENEPDDENSDNISGYSYDRLTYSFLNSEKDLGYNAGYSIPLSIYKVFFSDNQAQYFKSIDGTWGGSCFGFSSSSIILNNPEADLNYNMFNSEANKLSQLKVLDKYVSASESWTVRQLLEGLQVMQYNSEIQYQMWTKSESNVFSSVLLDKCKNISNGDIPIVLAIYKDGVGGHAIVPYKLENFSSTEDHLYVYDCNFSSADRYITLYKSNGNYTGAWFYKVNDYYNFGTNYSSKIAYCDYDTFYKVWTSRNKTVKNNVISIDTDQDVVIFDDNNKKVAAVSATGQFTSYDKNIHRMISLDGFNNLESGQVIAYMPEGEYTVSSSHIAAMDITVVGTVKMADYNGKCQSFNFDITENKNEIELSGCQSQKYSISLTSTDNTSDYIVNGTATNSCISADQKTGITQTSSVEVTEEVSVSEEITNNTETSSASEQVNKNRKVGKIKSLSVKKLSKSKKKVKCKITYKSTGNVDGYQVKINGKIVERKGKTYKVTLNKKKKYTIKVRPYVINTDKSVTYGAWKTKKIKL